MIMALISYKPDNALACIPKYCIPKTAPHDDRQTASLGVNHVSNKPNSNNKQLLQPSASLLASPASN